MSLSVKRCAIVIIGASGDLARRKLIPALHALYLQGKLDKSNIIVGAGRTHYSDEAFRERFKISDEFKGQLFYHQYITGLRSYLHSKGNFSNIIFFLSQPPVAYGPTARELTGEGFGQEASIIIEKPFGYDFESAHELNIELAACFKESQIYRIDHYLAKEAVQNIMVFRFANSLFYPVWNSHYIESIQINAIESNGITERGGYFDRSGIIRDMIQNHLIQLLSLLAMEAPVSLAADDIKNQKVCLLRNIKVEQVCRYQYEGYRLERGVDPSSSTETFVEMKLSINNLRWTGMPIYIRSGKAAHRNGTEIGIRFHPLPRLLFNEHGDRKPNQIIFKIQPAEGIVLDLSTKEPGTDEQVVNTYMNLCYKDSFRNKLPEAYQRLLFDALRGDHTLFVSAAETEAAWQIFRGVLDKGEVFSYTKGQLPSSKLNTELIDFDSYTHFCT